MVIYIRSVKLCIVSSYCSKGILVMAAYSDELLTVPEAAVLVGRDPHTIRRWIYNGFLKAQKGRGKYGRFRIQKSDLLKAVQYEPETRANEKTIVSR